MQCADRFLQATPLLFSGYFLTKETCESKVGAHGSNDAFVHKGLMNPMRIPDKGNDASHEAWIPYQSLSHQEKHDPLEQESRPPKGKDHSG